MRGSASAVFFIALLGFSWGCQEKKIDFSSQVKPILNKHCISCHGGVKRNANFSVLFRSEALDTTESGKLAIIPGDPEHSEM
ncbi:MAG TPA: c-type cytochrome domain-containing protein, partial [Chryseosolibacter sp.]|nr:c-type cytochrome domain-containing protein [Chryseosolibacter sp.]